MANIVEFLEARIAEDEGGADYLLGREDDEANAYGTRFLAECAAKRAIIKQHEEWPMLVEKGPTPLERDPIISGPSDLHGLSLVVSRRMAWLTEREYVKRFGVEPPTAPIIRTLAAVYADHPDYQKEWEL